MFKNSIIIVYLQKNDSRLRLGPSIYNLHKGIKLDPEAIYRNYMDRILSIDCTTLLRYQWNLYDKEPYLVNPKL